jgi:hypothetical protein
MIEESLELATSDQLINELMKRETFAGMIIRPTSYVRDEFICEEFQMTIRNMSKEISFTILERAMESLEEAK